jgi:hypothetical protein
LGIEPKLFSAKVKKRKTNMKKSLAEEKMKTNTSRFTILTMVFALTLGFSASVQASLTTYADFPSWSAVVGAQTATTIPDPGSAGYIDFGSGDASVTYGGVTFSTSSILGNGNFYNVGTEFSGNPPALSDQQESSGVANILITLPSAVTAFSLNYGYGTFYGSPVTFVLGNGDTFTQGSTGSGYSTVDFVGATDTTAFSTILVTSPDFVLNINNLVTSSSISAVPEATTMIAGMLLLLPFGASTLRILRKSRMA